VANYKSLRLVALRSERISVFCCLLLLSVTAFLGLFPVSKALALSDDSPWNRRKKKYTNLLLFTEPRVFLFCVFLWFVDTYAGGGGNDTLRTVVRRIGRVLDELADGWVRSGGNWQVLVFGGWECVQSSPLFKCDGGDDGHHEG